MVSTLLVRSPTQGSRASRADMIGVAAAKRKIKHEADEVSGKAEGKADEVKGKAKDAAAEAKRKL